jgi:hypothetical protein
MAFWRPSKNVEWFPATVNALPPVTWGCFTVIWFPRFDLQIVLDGVADHNKSALKFAPKVGGRIMCWAVPVHMTYDHDETAKIVEPAPGAAPTSPVATSWACWHEGGAA